jgi:hypothetical protein
MFQGLKVKDAFGEDWQTMALKILIIFFQI